MNIREIKMLISDVDGVWTDGSFYKGTDNIELKKFSVFDGVGVAMARAAKIKIALISGRFSSATEHRAKELGIEDVYNGTLNKLPVYEKLKLKYKLDDSNIAYIGDDLIDIPVMEVVVLPIAVANAIPDVKKIAAHITELSGGEGAFREAISWIISEQGRTEEVIQIMRERITNS
ncbi:MAG: KdsC family phosphatase [Candidatus Neomarinimicrobiota bacterium]|tara:strand:+ start:664 stop:1188 length:525 start_codon:yes stop_codon:yes gene_type:complete